LRVQHFHGRDDSAGDVGIQAAANDLYFREFGHDSG